MFQFDDFSKNEFELPRTRVLPDLRYHYGDFRGVRLHPVNKTEQEEKGQGSDLLLAVLRRPLAPRCKESGGRCQGLLLAGTTAAFIFVSSIRLQVLFSTDLWHRKRDH
jgi:hypothetical protein